MDFWTFIFAVAALSITAGVINNWIRARHGYPIPVEQAHGGSNFAEIRAENDQLKERVAELTDRLHVLERIATDPANRTAREIEQLR